MIDPKRAQVLSAVKAALRDAQASTPPSGDSVAEATISTAGLAERFVAELTALDGFAKLVRDDAECVAVLTSYLKERGVHSVAVQSTPLAKRIAAQLVNFEVSRAVDRTKGELEKFDCGLLEARALLADTGSAILLLDNASDRVLPYLPRTCVIVARIESLHSGMNAQAMQCIENALSARVRGEAVIVAGPSRTADIEKTLVLGAHGPEALAVFLIVETASLGKEATARS